MFWNSDCSENISVCDITSYMLLVMVLWKLALINMTEYGTLYKFGWALHSNSDRNLISVLEELLMTCGVSKGSISYSTAGSNLHRNNSYTYKFLLIFFDFILVSLCRLCTNNEKINKWMQFPHPRIRFEKSSNRVYGKID